MPARIGDRPHPRILVRGFDEELAGHLSKLAGTVRPIGHLSEVEQNEFDLLVNRGNLPPGLEPDLYAIVVSDHPTANDFGGISTVGGSAQVGYGDMSRATSFSIADGLPAPLDRLVREVLAPRALSNKGQPQGVLAARITAVHAQSARPAPAEISGWLGDSRGRVLAGHFSRVGGKTECWCLPSYITDLAPWVSAALDIWTLQDRLRFPSRDGEWQLREAWQTPAEQATSRTLSEHRARAEATARELAAQEQALREELEGQRTSADDHERLLLTAQGDELVSAVATALTSLGFSVDNMDLRWPAGQRREDLRVHSPERDWTAIVEVRGYGGGGQVNDLMRVARFQRRYLQDEGAPPSKAWYVVNQFRDRDPDLRDPLLASNPQEVTTFGEDDGAVIDTRTLFRLWMDVRRGSVTEADARAVLQAATGALLYP